MLIEGADPRYPRYHLFIRRHDHKMRLVEQYSGRTVHIEAIVPVKSGLVVRPVNATGVLLMAGEVVVVDEFLERK